MPVIFRIEHEKTKEGPFYNSLQLVSLSRFDSLNTPREDGLIIRRGEEYCAFISFEMIEYFFNKEIVKFLIKERYLFKMIDVKECRVGKHNVLFKRDCIVEEIDVTKDVIEFYDKQTD